MKPPRTSSPAAEWHCAVCAQIRGLISSQERHAVLRRSRATVRAILRRTVSKDNLPPTTEIGE